jgi:hypothetical protein
MLTFVDMSEVEALAGRLDGVRCRREDGLLTCRYHGRLVARQVDATHVVIRCSFDVRGAWLGRFPETFSVPARFAKHMMIVADLAGDAGAIEDALIAAWQLQSQSAGTEQ